MLHSLDIDANATIMQQTIKALIIEKAIKAKIQMQNGRIVDNAIKIMGQDLRTIAKILDGIILLTQLTPIFDATI